MLFTTPVHSRSLVHRAKNSSAGEMTSTGTENNFTTELLPGSVRFSVQGVIFRVCAISACRAPSFSPSPLCRYRVRFSSYTVKGFSPCCWQAARCVMARWNLTRLNSTTLWKLSGILALCSSRMISFHISISDSNLTFQAAQVLHISFSSHNQRSRQITPASYSLQQICGSRV